MVCNIFIRRRAYSEGFFSGLPICAEDFRHLTLYQLLTDQPFTGRKAGKFSGPFNGARKIFPANRRAALCEAVVPCLDRRRTSYCAAATPLLPSHTEAIPSCHTEGVARAYLPPSGAGQRTQRSRSVGRLVQVGEVNGAGLFLPY